MQPAAGAASAAPPAAGEAATPPQDPPKQQQFGKIAKLMKRCGFITPAASRLDVFFHFNSLEDASLEEGLRVGQDVRFTLSTDPATGRPQAACVGPLPAGAVQLERLSTLLLVGRVHEPCGTNGASGLLQFIGPDVESVHYVPFRQQSPALQGGQAATAHQASVAAGIAGSGPVFSGARDTETVGNNHESSKKSQPSRDAQPPGQAAQTAPHTSQSAAARPPLLAAGDYVTFRLLEDLRAARAVRAAGHARGVAMAHRAVEVSASSCVCVPPVGCALRQQFIAWPTSRLTPHHYSNQNWLSRCSHAL